MKDFIEKHKNKVSYKDFCQKTKEHLFTLQEIYQLIQDHHSESFSIFDVTKIGFLLKVYYELHANVRYENSLKYSFGFEGFLDNLRGVKLHVFNGNINHAKISNAVPLTTIVSYA